jgi:hypothetical protein
MPHVGTISASVAAVRRKLLHVLTMMLPLALGSLGACAAATDEYEDDLTSISARSRKLSFDGVLYFEPGVSDRSILESVRAQTQTAFGPLREQRTAVKSRELRDVDASSFRKRTVRVVDTERVDAAPKSLLEVRYTYTDHSVVPLSYATRSTIATAALNPSAVLRDERRARRECTADDVHSRPYPLWYEFNPTLAKCKDAMKEEAKSLRADRALLVERGEDILTRSEVERMYLPLTVNLGADRTEDGATYPEYDRLFAGGVDASALVVGLVYGPIDDKMPAAGPHADSGYLEWTDNLRTLLKARPYALKSIRGVDSIAGARLSTGKVVHGLSFEQIIGWPHGEIAGLEGLTAAESKELQKEMGSRLYRHWVTLEAPITVKIGAGRERDFTIRILTYFGVDEDRAPHAFAFKNSDIYIYNGHSYVGAGPLDPKNFGASDFPNSYQILFFDSCVSYNYYHEGYLPYKDGGTKNLDFITNGLEAPSWKSGRASGKLLNRLLDGTGASYKALLEEAKATDALRVVDGELDNKYRPTRTKITLGVRP